MKLLIILGIINLVESKRFRDNKNHLPIDYNAKKARNNNAIVKTVTGDEHMQMILDQMKKVDYDKYHKPNFPEFDENKKKSTNLDVSINMFIDTIQGISESSMTYEITLFFRQFWIDPRLKWGIIENAKGETEIEYKRVDKTYNVAADMVDLLWVPDTFFIDEIDSRRHTIMTKNVFLEIHPDGHILFSERLTMKLKCPMHLRYYPFDLQICPIRIESYAFRDSQLKIQWHNTQQIEINPDIALPTFRLTEFLVRKECSREHTTGDFSCLEGFLVLRRRISYYFIHMFIPSTLCVIVSWTSFWIKLESAPARVTCGILTFLAISAWTQAFNAELPKVSYIKAIDVWTVSCNIFVFLSLMEYAFAQVFLRMKQNDISRRRNSGDLHADAPEVMYWNGIGSGSEGIWVDKLSRKLFPMIFTLFNLLYWIICCSAGHMSYPANVHRNPIELIEA